MERLVRYNNDMNRIKFSGFTAVDYDFFFAICAKLNENPNAAVFKHSELRLLTGFSRQSNKEAYNALQLMKKKLLSQNTGFFLSDQKTYREAPIIDYIDTVFSDDGKTVEEVSIHPRKEFLYLFTEISKNFTRFELHEFVSLESKYSKTIYRLLKQYRTTGRYSVSFDDLKILLDVPEKYTARRVMDKIIKPAVNELRGYFTNLVCNTSRASTPGRPVKGFVFLFEPDQAYTKQEKTPAKKKKNSFTSHKQNQYDFEKLEKTLTGEDKL